MVARNSWQTVAEVYPPWPLKIKGCKIHFLLGPGWFSRANCCFLGKAGGWRGFAVQILNFTSEVSMWQRSPEGVKHRNKHTHIHTCQYNVVHISGVFFCIWYGLAIVTMCSFPPRSPGDSTDGNTCWNCWKRSLQSQWLLFIQLMTYDHAWQHTSRMCLRLALVVESLSSFTVELPRCPG